MTSSTYARYNVNYQKVGVRGDWKVTPQSHCKQGLLKRPCAGEKTNVYSRIPLVLGQDI